MTCSPHPRGWSLETRSDGSSQRLLPAPAGMVPAHHRGAAHRSAAPRTRGDGPTAAAAGLSWTGCSPHPRGWSRNRRAPASCPGMLPAPAGMVPRTSAPAGRPPPAPRTRGDGPFGTWLPQPVPACSPHPRGWSHRECPVALGRTLLPAPAGMVPSSPRRTSRCRPAPRTRGDGPSKRRCSPTSSPCSPHLRGWSHPGRGPDLRSRLLPAPAGSNFKESPVLFRVTLGPLQRIDKGSERRAGHGQGAAGRTFRVADGYARVAWSNLDTGIAVAATRVGRLLPEARGRHRGPHSSFTSRWMRSRERRGSSATAFTLRKSVRKTPSCASLSTKSAP